MLHKCPYCGEKIDEQKKCVHCNRNIEWVQIIYTKSTYLYAKAYQEAKRRNLTTAILYLKKSLYFNKYNIIARNLLGLIYLEMGNSALALKEWVISISLDKDNNIAQEYIERIQKESSQLIAYKDAIILYNRALGYLKQNNHDMAVIRLKKAVALNTHLIEARNLLAVCYIKGKQFYKANEQIKQVLSIDRSNLKALTYFKMISNEQISVAQPYERKYIPEQLDKQVIKPTYIINKSSVISRHALYFVIGCMCMFAIQYFLFLPYKTKVYKNQINTLKESELNLKQFAQQIRDEMNNELEELRNENEKLLQDKQTLELDKSIMMQNQKINEATLLKNNKQWIESAELLYDIGASLLDSSGLEQYEMLKTEVYPIASRLLYNESYRHFTLKQYTEGKAKLERLMLYNPQQDILRKSLYYLGQIEKDAGNIEKAKSYFNTLTLQHPGTNEATWALAELKKLPS